MEYALLREIHKKHPDVILMAFPSPDFGDQEFKDPAEVVEFAEKNGPPGLVVFMPDHVKNEPVRETYEWLSKELGTAFTSTLVWNFKGKFIVDYAGKPHVTKDPLKDIPKFLSGKKGCTEDVTSSVNEAEASGQTSGAA